MENHKVQGGFIMFNCAVFSGQVQNTPALSSTHKDRPHTSFFLTIWDGQRKVGSVKVVCYSVLATIAAKYLRMGDRVAVVGFLSMESWQPDESVWKNDASLIAVDLELIRGEAPAGWE
jgi:single-stranded DNA-binding protein